MLKIICSSAVLSGFELSVFDFNGELKSVSTALNAEYVSNDQEMYDYLSALIPEFKERNTLKKECAEQDLTDKELYEKMQKFRKKIMVIGDLVEFVKHISAPGEGVGSMSGLMCNLLDKGANHNIFWFAAFNQDQIGEVQTDDIFKVFTRDRNGIHFGGNLQAQRLLSFEHVKYNEQGKKQPAGVGMLPSNSMDDTKAVVVPFYRISQ